MLKVLVFLGLAVVVSGRYLDLLARARDLEEDDDDDEADVCTPNKGTCVGDSEACAGVKVDGMCPDSKKCCFKFTTANSHKCHDAGNVCTYEANQAACKSSGKVVVGRKCPGPTTVKCCEPAPPAPAPGTRDALPRYYQCDNPYRCVPYAGTAGSCTDSQCDNQDPDNEKKNVICTSACGPTSLAMIATYFGQTATPSDVVSKLVNQGYRNGGATGAPSGATCSGTSHAGLIWAAGQYNLNLQWHEEGCAYPGCHVTAETWDETKTSAVIAALEAHPIILHVREISGDSFDCKYTNGGHYIVLKEYNAGTKTFVVHDPGSHNSARETGTASELFEECAVAGYGVLTKKN